MHSSTKFLGGHSDVLGGALLTSDGALAERMRFHQNAVGARAVAVRLLAAAARA